MRDSSKPLSTREAILEATSRALASVGYKKMKIEDLAREVGIGKGSVYLHFKSKEDIVLAHIDSIFSDLRARMHEVETSSLTAAERVELVLTAHVMMRFDAVRNYPKGLNEILAVVRDRLLERRKQYFAAEAEILARIIRDGVAGGEFDVSDELVAGKALVDATNALLPFNLSAKEIGDRDEVEARLTAISNILIDGLRYRCQ